METVLKAYTGELLSFTDLRTLIAELTMLLLVVSVMPQVFIPRQVIRDGVLLLKENTVAKVLFEGKPENLLPGSGNCEKPAAAGKRRVRNEAPFADSAVHESIQRPSFSA